MHRGKAGGCVTGGACFLVPLIANTNNRADPIVVASGANQLKIKPVPRLGLVFRQNSGLSPSTVTTTSSLPSPSKSATAAPRCARGVAKVGPEAGER